MENYSNLLLFAKRVKDCFLMYTDILLKFSQLNIKAVNSDPRWINEEPPTIIEIPKLLFYSYFVVVRCFGCFYWICREIIKRLWYLPYPLPTSSSFPCLAGEISFPHFNVIVIVGEMAGRMWWRRKNGSTWGRPSQSFVHKFKFILFAHVPSRMYSWQTEE